MRLKGGVGVYHPGRPLHSGEEYHIQKMCQKVSPWELPVPN